MPFWAFFIITLLVIAFIAFVTWLHVDDYYKVNGQPGESAYRIINNTAKEDLYALYEYILGEDSHHAEYMSATEYEFYEVNLLYLMYVADTRIFREQAHQFGNVLRTLTKRPTVAARSAHSFASLLKQMASAMPELYAPQTIAKYQSKMNEQRMPSPQYN